MNISTEDEALKELLVYGETKDKRYRKLPKNVIAGFRKAVNLLEIAERIEDLFVYHGLNYEKLRGRRKGYESVRCTGRWRLIFKSSAKEGCIEITEICLTEISDHYDDN